MLDVVGWALAVLIPLGGLIELVRWRRHRRWTAQIARLERIALAAQTQIALRRGTARKAALLQRQAALSQIATLKPQVRRYELWRLR